MLKIFKKIGIGLILALLFPLFSFAQDIDLPNSSDAESLKNIDTIGSEEIIHNLPTLQLEESDGFIRPEEEELTTERFSESTALEDQQPVFIPAAPPAEIRPVRYKLPSPRSFFQLLLPIPDPIIEIIDQFNDILVDPICPAPEITAPICSLSIVDVSSPSNDYQLIWQCGGTFRPCTLHANDEVVGHLRGAGVANLNLGSERTTIYELKDRDERVCGGGIVHTFRVNTTPAPQGSTFACGTAITDSRDGKTYDTVLLGGICWFAEHINVGTRIAGGTNLTDNGIIEKHCYDESEANCTTDGGLYEWDEAMQYATACNGTGESQPACSTPVQGICPDGWHIPSHYEWNALERAVCDSASCETDFPFDDTTSGTRGTNEGTKLKVGGSSGFEGILAGYGFNGSWDDRGSVAEIWSSSVDNMTPDPDFSAAIRYLFDSDATLDRGGINYVEDLSVRCVQD